MVSPPLLAFHGASQVDAQMKELQEERRRLKLKLDLADPPPVAVCLDHRHLAASMTAPSASTPTTPSMPPWVQSITNRKAMPITHANLGYHASADIVANAASALATHAARVSNGFRPAIPVPSRPSPACGALCLE
uniref:Uncharacterized protein n=1 Tax=Alexandrium catenella TaxID=2925 RepID=A0A7S1WGG8_ALECA